MPSNKAVIGAGRQVGGAARSNKDNLLGYLADFIRADSIEDSEFPTLLSEIQRDHLTHLPPGERKAALIRLM
jgi:hypothetical protein